jgi:hypothetical protein
MSRERRTARSVEVVGQPADPAEHLEGSDVEVRALPLPGRDEAVDLILHGVQYPGRFS